MTFTHSHHLIIDYHHLKRSYNKELKRSYNKEHIIFTTNISGVEYIVFINSHDNDIIVLAYRYASS
ncbi:hypothetical protein CPJCM30710_22670 [Clostridium polyendosporum]|uniref:Uncharacterized protein n=1 Tax=Clostridium polyendosporum TaxID=69208 RepID=A0A919S0B2_9CLOT|nr:hypothetical protein CPJCM30710_22670 [Clostridium polyendosporum]